MHGLQSRENHETFFGGVVAFANDDFVRANGYSNGYWGWGLELMAEDGLSTAAFRVIETAGVPTEGLPEPPRGAIRRHLVEV